ncbi:hypothetical protein BDZ91DRAFT_65416 [Kalaharituber pfeilii]|nr:hypothetical protein BDZ91DRAFT_65416 [Kalaharituber pfeilii]
MGESDLLLRVLPYLYILPELVIAFCGVQLLFDFGIRLSLKPEEHGPSGVNGTSSARNGTCGTIYLNQTVEGDSDLYGIGVRIGIYIQLFATAFTNLARKQFYCDSTLTAANIWTFIALSMVSCVALGELPVQRDDEKDGAALINGYTTMILAMALCLVTMLGTTDIYYRAANSLFATGSITIMGICCVLLMSFTLKKLGPIEDPNESPECRKSFRREVYGMAAIAGGYFFLLFVLMIYRGCIIIRALKRFELCTIALEEPSPLRATEGPSPLLATEETFPLWKLGLDYMLRAPMRELDIVIFGIGSKNQDQSHSETLESRLRAHVAKFYSIDSESTRREAWDRLMNSLREQRLEPGPLTRWLEEKLPSVSARLWKVVPFVTFYARFIAACFIISCTIWSIEQLVQLTNKAKTNDLNSTGQLIALIVSIGVSLSLLDQMYHLWRANCSRQESVEFSVARTTKFDEEKLSDDEAEQLRQPGKEE